MLKRFTKICGASLIEVIIAAFVLSVVGLGALVIFRNTLSTNQVSEEIAEASAAQLELFAALSSERVCLTNFGGINPVVPAALNSVNDLSGPILQVGQIYSKRLRILPAPNGIRREPALNPAQRPGPNGRGRVDLVVNFSVESNPAKTQNFRLPVMVQTEANQVISCSSQGSTRDDCRYIRASSTGSRTSVNCPAGYRVVGGGISDTDFTKESFYSIPVAAQLGSGTGSGGTISSPSYSSTGPYATFHPASGGSTAGISNITVAGELRFNIPASQIPIDYDLIVVRARGATSDGTYPTFTAKIDGVTLASNIPTTATLDDHEAVYQVTANNAITIGIEYENPAPGRTLTVSSLQFYTAGETGPSDWGGWRCFSDDSGGTLRCYAVCCK